MGLRRVQPELAEAGAGRWRWIAPCAVIALAAVVACCKVWTVDVFWQLKSGQWMLEQGRVLGHDPFSVDGADKWVNVHWLFQILVAAIHRIGGFSGLVVLKMAAFGGLLAALTLGLRRRIGPGWLMLAGLWLILTVETRIRVRPEIFTYLLLMVTLLIVESVRRGASPKRLWWLVPINMLWVNVHGVYIVGIASAWMALAGAGLDRLLKRPTAGNLASVQALLPIVVATAACFVSPWPVEAALHPLLLRTRVTGEQRLYSFGVQEFRPTYLFNPFRRVPLLVALLGAVAVLEVLRGRRRSVPTGHALVYAAFLVLGMLAVRNVTLFAVPAGFLLAVHGGEWVGRATRRRSLLRKLATPARVVMLLLLAATAAAYATEASYRWMRRPASRFGFGLVEGEHPIEMAKWLGRSDLEGDILPLEFGQGGAFICYAYPRRKVWMDGRLEVHSMKRLEKLYEYRAKMLSSRTAGDPAEMPLPKTIRFIAVRSSDTAQIRALSKCEDRFKLIYVDRAGVCFVRLPVKGEEDNELLWKWHLERALPPANLDQFDRPLEASAPAPLLDVPTRRTWYRQNVSPAHWYMGEIFYFLGRYNLAVRYLTAADRLGLQEPIHTAGMLAWAHQSLAEYQPIEPEFELCDLPVDPNLARALALYERMDLSDMSDLAVRSYALNRLHALFTAGHIDAGSKAMKRYLESLPIPTRWHPGAEVIRLADAIKVRYGQSLATRDSSRLPGLDPAEHAYLLLDQPIDSEHKTGLIDAAIEVLASAPKLPPRSRMLLGDLYLRKGQTGLARRQYEAAAEMKMDQDWALQMRRGLCCWAAGDLGGAVAGLRQAARSNPKAPEPAVYLALLQEQLGDYAAVGEALRRYDGPTTQPTDNQAVQLLVRIGARLKTRE